MITGFNSEIRFGDTTYHVQTEDRGKKAGRIDTIIYRSGGAVIHRKQIFYKDILNCSCVEETVRELMEEVHALTINEIKKGLWTLGAEAIPDVSVQDVLRKYLLEPSRLDGLQINNS